MSETESNLEKTIQESKTKKGFIDGLKAVPSILGCSGLAFLLNFSGCSPVEKYMGDGLNLGFHLAAGSGIYGGYTSKTGSKVASLMTLVTSYFFSALTYAPDGDIKKIGAALGLNTAGYGLGYVSGYLFSEGKEAIEKSS